VDTDQEYESGFESDEDGDIESDGDEYDEEDFAPSSEDVL